MQAPARHRARSIVLGTLGSAVAALAIGTALAIRLASQSSPGFAASSAGPTPEPTQYAVNPGGTSTNNERCLMPAVNYSQSQPDWGEDYLSAKALVVNFTGDADKHISDLRGAVPSDCSIVVRIVQYSAAEEWDLQARIVGDEGALKGAGVDVTNVWFDPISDRVWVGVSTLTPAVTAELERRYSADRISVVQRDAPVPL